MTTVCFCSKREKSKFHDFEDLDNSGSPGSHKIIVPCTNCSGAITETIVKHSFKKDMGWSCICGAKDPTK